MSAPEAHLDGRVRLHVGDMADVLATLPDCSVDSVVCDPPYHLTSIVKRFGAKGAAAAKHGTDGAFARASRGFMGQQWDGGDVAFRVATWAAVLRVLKPGGHLVAFSGTRTYHRMACAIEDAGFEIRDQYAWLYGSGFPKSHDVAKGIAKRRTEDLEPTRGVCRFIRRAMDAKGLVSRDLVQHFGHCNPRLIDHWAARDTDSQPSLPTPEQWATLKDVLALGAEMDAEVARLNARKGSRGERWLLADVVGEVASDAAGFGDHRFAGDRSIRHLDDDAAVWTGWGTAAKPAHEPIALARKPLAEGSVAANVLAWGVGAINIGGCRLQIIGDEFTRFPANVLHDGSDNVLAGFPDPAAARFFFSAKADSDDRLGSKHPTVKPVDLMQWLVRLVTPPKGVVLDPFAGTGTTGEAAWREGFDAVLVERDPAYAEDIRRRMALALAGPQTRKAESIKARGVVADAGPLFAGEVAE
jgi:DNA modification methylase